MAEEGNAGYASSGVGQIEDKQNWRGSTVNGAFERVENPYADPAIQPEIQLLEGWRNGNIKIGTADPTVTPPANAHTWDIYIQVPSGTDWTLASNVYVKRPL